MKRRRHKNISVLLVPDDYTEPINFRVSTKKLKLLAALAFLLVIHFITGGIFYWKFAVVKGENKGLRQTNEQLKEDNQKIYNLYADFTQLERSQQKIRTALGIDQATEEGKPEELEMEGSELLEKLHATPSSLTLENEDQTLRIRKNLKFLSRSNSAYHDFAQNLPTLLPVDGVLTTDFTKGDWFTPYSHLGIDIAAKKGTVVRAAGDGIIVFANWIFRLGNLIIIYHGSGLFTYYGHNQRILKGENSFVKKGEPIALLGSSGISTGPHLHFEIRKDGVSLDPKNYILAFQK
jgi:murein DD-endopeptidase MepM/ murein hydrolase activator NlpD